jgi:hypothetical protein
VERTISLLPGKHHSGATLFSHVLIIPQDPQESFGKFKNKPDCEPTFNDYLTQNSKNEFVSIFSFEVIITSTQQKCDVAVMLSTPSVIAW